MTEPGSSDTPVRQTLAEHRALRALVDEIEGASTQTPAAVLKALLDTFWERLAAHFEGEEGTGGFFEHILEEAPEQAHECGRLRDEHAGLLKRLDELRSASAEAMQQPAWAQGLHAFLQDFTLHEGRENELLTRTLDGSVEAQD